VRRSEAGQVAGVETLALGTLVFVVGTLVAVNAWSIVTSRAVADDIATSYLRAYTEGTGAADARLDGNRAADAARSSHSFAADRVEIEEPDRFAPCEMVSVTATIAVPLVRIPVVGAVGSTQITITRRERIDPYRSGGGEFEGVSPCEG
jgi:hypothetical protein